MEEDDENTPFPICTSGSSNIAESSTIIEEGPRICPLCNSIVGLFYINFKEQVLMCENGDCEFPFGYEDVKLVKVDRGADDNDEIGSTQSRTDTSSAGQKTSTGSVVSTSAWADIEILNRIYDSEDGQLDLQALSAHSDKNSMYHKLQKEKQRESAIMKNLENIEQLSKAINEPEESDCRITNEKWIKNLHNYQQMSGFQLLRQDEIKKLKKKELALGHGELKIDIDSHTETIPSIKIEIANKQK